jgi:hypothetical protein
MKERMPEPQIEIENFYPQPVVANIAYSRMYCGIENEIYIAVPGIKNENAIVKIDNGSITKKENHFIVIPEKIGEVTFSITFPYEDSTLTATWKFRSCGLPTPDANVAGTPSGKVKKEMLSLSKRLSAKANGNEYDLKYSVKSFSMKTSLSEKIFSSGSSSLTHEMKDEFPNLKTGDTVEFFNIESIGPDKKIYNPDPIKLIIE